MPVGVQWDAPQRQTQVRHAPVESLSFPPAPKYTTRTSNTTEGTKAGSVARRITTVRPALGHTFVPDWERICTFRVSHVYPSLVAKGRTPELIV